MALLDLFTSRKAKEQKAAAAAAEAERLRLQKEEQDRLSREQAARDQEQARLAEQKRLADIKAGIDVEAMDFEQITGEYANKPEVRTVNAVCTDIAAAEQSVREHDARHAAAVAQLLPIEAALKRTLDEQHQQFKSAKNTELWKLRQELERSGFDAQFPRINMDFLKRRKWSANHNCGLPLFAIFNLTHPVCQIEAIARNGGRRAPLSMNLHPRGDFNVHFADTLKTLGDKASHNLPQWHSRMCAIRAEFSGAIPPNVREIVKSHQKQFEALFLVGEAPEWTIIQEEYRDVDWRFEASFQPQPIPAGRDPLLIGLKQGIYWLLAAFDTTPAEEYVRREYTEGKLS